LRKARLRQFWKHPRTANGHRDATSDVGAVGRFWERFPHANIGLVTGERNDLFVVDVDGPRGVASLQTLEDTYGTLPNTWVSLTGGGGLHYFFAGGLTLRNSQGRLGANIDVRASGGYVVVPPSTHRSGKRYRFRSGASPADIELALAPEWLLRLAEPSSPVVAPRAEASRTTLTQRVRRARAYVASMPIAISGQGGNHTTYRVALALVKGFGLPEDDAFGILAEYNEACQPPWRHEHLRQKLACARSANRVPDGFLIDDSSIGVPR
jgi:hypothetical protein